MVLFFYCDLEIQMWIPGIADIKHIEAHCDCTLEVQHQDLAQGAPLQPVALMQFSKP